MNIISLLDGCSGAYQALQLAGIKIDKYYASEIEKYPISVSAANFPDIVNFGDVQNIYTHWGLMDNNF